MSAEFDKLVRMYQTACAKLDTSWRAEAALRRKVRNLQRRVRMARAELDDWNSRPSRRGDLRAYHLLDLRKPLPLPRGRR